MSTGLPENHVLRKAAWLWAGHDLDLRNRYAQFRRDFDLNEPPTHAPLHITADQQYVLYVNGVFAGRGPARGYQHRWPFDTIDVAPLLRRGHNWLSALVHTPGISTFQYLHQGTAGLLCAARWGAFELVSDGAWIGRSDPARRWDTARLSLQLSFQEHVDLRLDDQRWITAETAPADWKEPVSVRPFGVMPWHDLEPRNLPNLTGERVTYAHAVAEASGAAIEGWADWRDIKAGWRLERAALPWGQVSESRYSAAGGLLRLAGAGTGEVRAVVLDLGQPGVGTFELVVDEAAGGEVIDLFACEWLDDDGGPHVPEPGACCHAAMAARITLKAGQNRLETFHLIGHRYLTVILRQSPRPLSVKLHLRRSIYPLQEQGRFECDDPTLNDIFRICRDTQRVCMPDAYVDTPWREQAQWWGDARVQAWNTFHLSDDTRLLERGIRQIAEQRVPNGLTYGHAPTMAHSCVLPDFSLIWCLTLFDHYWQTGRPDLLVELWPQVERLLGYFDDPAHRRDGLLKHDPRYWLFLDWTDLQKEGVPTLLNLWYVHALAKLAEVAEAAAERAIKAALDQRRDMIVSAIMAQLFDEERGLFHDGILPSGRPSGTHSIHNQTVAILAQLAGPSAGAMWAQSLLPYLRGEGIEGALPSSYWVTYVYDVARRAGHDALVLAHLARQWRPMIPFGGCSEWFVVTDEAPQPPRGYAGTFSHAWAAHPIHHLMGSLGGVVQRAPAWREVRFCPTFVGATSCEVVVPTPHGLIRSQWRRQADTIDVRLSLPAEVRAEVVLALDRPVAHHGRTAVVHPCRRIARQLSSSGWLLLNHLLKRVYRKVMRRAHLPLQVGNNLLSCSCGASRDQHVD